MTTRNTRPAGRRIAEASRRGLSTVSARVERASDRVSEGVASLSTPSALIDRPTRRRAGVFRRALRHEVARVREPRRLVMIALLGFLGGFMLACLIARGEAAGADTRAYWAAGRLWLSGGDPYHPTGPFMPYVYSPWMLPLFAPWSILPWDVAWFVWRGATAMAMLWSIHWAYKLRPGTTTVLLILLSFPIAANLDTGNINLPLALMIFAAQFSGPRTAGLLWAAATTLKWVPLLFWPLLTPRGRLWGIFWLVLALLLTVATLPATLVQLKVLFDFPRPIRIDYLVFIWAAVPWMWRNPQAFRWLMPETWPGIARAGTAAASIWRLHWRRSPERTTTVARRVVRARVRAFLGIGEA
jgi:hypothetical protein